MAKQNTFFTEKKSIKTIDRLRISYLVITILFFITTTAVVEGEACSAKEVAQKKAQRVAR